MKTSNERGITTLDRSMIISHCCLSFVLHGSMIRDYINIFHDEKGHIENVSLNISKIVFLFSTCIV